MRRPFPDLRREIKNKSSLIHADFLGSVVGAPHMGIGQTPNQLSVRNNRGIGGGGFLTKFEETRL